MILGLKIHGFDESLFLVRSLVDQAAQSWDLPGDVAYTVKLIANEFATNAIAATPGQTIVVRIMRHQGGVLTEVWDSADLPPLLQIPAEVSAPGGGTPDAADALESICENGRGLFLVDSLADRTGFRWVQPPGKGKIVWALVAC